MYVNGHSLRVKAKVQLVKAFWENILSVAIKMLSQIYQNFDPVISSLKTVCRFASLVGVICGFAT